MRIKVTYIQCPAYNGDSVTVTKWDGVAAAAGGGARSRGNEL